MGRPSGSWLLVFVLVWWILAGTGLGAWVAGAVAITVGMLVHSALGGEQGARPTIRGVAAFAPFFLDQSIRGGLDVARRALSRRPQLDPHFIRYRTSLPEGPPRVFFVSCISLLPGTFSAEFDGDEVRIHLLSDDGSGCPRLGRLEEAVGRLFGVPLSDSEAAAPGRVAGAGP